MSDKTPVLVKVTGISGASLLSRHELNAQHVKPIVLMVMYALFSDALTLKLLLIW